ncbi:MAG: glycosyltransferase [Fuerstiella sp.]
MEASNGLKILGCITELDIGGAEKAFVRILLGLQASGWTVQAVSLRDAGPLSDKLTQAGIVVDALGCGGIADFRAFWRLRRLVQSSNPDVVLSFLHQANFYSRLAAGSRPNASIISGIRVADRRKSIILPDSWTSGRVDHYVGVSQEVMRQHQQWCGLAAERCSWIGNGVDLPEGIDQIPRAENELLFVGRLTDQKSPETLLNALSIVRRQGNLLRLKMVGTGPLLTALRRQCEQLGLEDVVEFLGQRADVPMLMQKATALVLPSKWEGMPNVVLEAMANGLPVIASDVDGIRDVIVDGVTGLLVAPTDPDLLASAMIRMVSQTTLRRNLAKTAMAEVAVNYSWDSVVGQYDDLLRRLVAIRTS